MNEENIKRQVHEAATVFEVNPELVQKPPIKVEHTYEASIEEVWAALTDKEKMKVWYFDLTDFKAEQGFRFSFPGQGLKGEQYQHLCVITDLIPKRKLQYSWEYKDLPGYSLLTFFLTDLNRKTHLKLTHHGVETFPQDSPDFARSSFEDGWNHIIATSLAEYLKKNRQ